VLILPPGHALTVKARRRLSPREKWMVGGVLAALAVLAAVVVVSLATAGRSTGNGCIDVNLSSSLGNQEFYRCGDAARKMCASVGPPGGFTGRAARDIATECRKVSLPVGGG
jgi:hypothetical protein